VYRYKYCLQEFDKMESQFDMKNRIVERKPENYYNLRKEIKE